MGRINVGGGPKIPQMIITPTISDVPITKGMHDGTGYVIGDANLLSSNILSGKSIFGVSGTVVAGKGTASGMVYSGSMSSGSIPSTISVTKTVYCPFVPRVIVLYGALYVSSSIPAESSSVFSTVNHTRMFRPSDNYAMTGTTQVTYSSYTGLTDVISFSYGATSFDIRMYSYNGSTNVYMWTKWIAYE